MICIPRQIEIIEGIASSLDEYITNFLSGDSDLGYKGAYQTHIDSLKAQNERIDDKVESLNKYLESREKQLSDGFIKMEEMQSSMDGQMQAHFRILSLKEIV